MEGFQKLQNFLKPAKPAAKPAQTPKPAATQQQIQAPEVTTPVQPTPVNPTVNPPTNIARPGMPQPAAPQPIPAAVPQPTPAPMPQPAPTAQPLPTPSPSGQTDQGNQQLRDLIQSMLTRSGTPQ